MMTKHLSRLIQALALLIAGALAMIATPAWAGDAVCSGGGNNGEINFNLNPLGSNVVANAPNGTLLSSTVSLNEVSSFICDRPNSSYVAFGWQVVPTIIDTGMTVDSSIFGKNCDGCTGLLTVYASGVPGLGYVLAGKMSATCNNGASYQIWSGDVGSHARYHVGPGLGWSGYECPPGTQRAALSSKMVFGLVKTGPIGSGKFITGLLMQTASFTGDDHVTPTKTASGAATGHSQWIMTGPPVITVATCLTTVNGSASPSTVILPDIGAGDFHAANTKYNSARFTMNISCSNGVGRNLVTYLGFTDDTDQGNKTSNLTVIQTPGTASAGGVALRITPVGQPDIVFGPDTTNPTSASSQWLNVGTIAPSGTTKFNPLTFDVAYVQPDAAQKVTPGPVKAKATYTLIYQ